MIETLAWLTFALNICGILYAYWTSRDPLHPLVVIAPMFAFLYAWMPLRLAYNGGLNAYLTEDQVLFVQSLNLVGNATFIFGCLYGGAAARARNMDREVMSPDTLRTVNRVAFVVIFIGLLAWLKTMYNVGGISEAFNRAYGGGWDDSGYVRETTNLIWTGILLLQLQGQLKSFNWWHQAVLACLAFPSLIYSLLGARRSPLFVVSLILITGWYLNRRRRPSLTLLGVGGFALGYLMLLLVTNRSQIHLGSDFQLKADVSAHSELSGPWNEFIYGSGTVLHASEGNKFYWGRRYLTYLFIRPIPREIWPTKYEDIGMPELLVNAGTGGGDFRYTLGWSGSNGAAPGIIADLWIEVSWFSVVLLWLLGYLYGMSWRNAVGPGGLWVPQYVALLALSIFLVVQTAEAWGIRVIFISVPLWFIRWRTRARVRSTAPSPLESLEYPPLHGRASELG